MPSRLPVIGLVVLVVVLAFADGVKFARYQDHRDDLSYRFSRLFHHQEPGWLYWLRPRLAL